MVMEGAVAVVTGAAQGIGEAVARALTATGTRVAALDVNAERVARVAADLGVAVAYPCQVTDSAAVDDVVARVEADLGPIGLLVNVAGVLCSGPAVAISDDDWARTFAVNTGGVFHLSRAVARRMIPRRSGAIVTVGSNAAGVPRTDMSAYAASKAAAAQFTKCLGLELAQYGIRCNVVSPGSTDTPMQRALWAGGHDARTVIDGSPASFRVGIPLGRLADPADIADAVLFLASDRARHITMQDLYVDGGATLRS
ncbi:2,3-dihydro-2,3-dihydroxybenzoate dehydrogenase [Streptosporangium sp. NPDC000509]|uniref:2,3-dihydro-2,3-dihydroxybenzoate dehydrogenase n=1 Tax=Streptosporangium sp. NPDC000509 TaxID=3366186 RepID=UPI0036A8E616